MSMHLLFVATTDQDQDETQGKAIRTSLAEALGQDIQFHFQRYTDQQGLLPFYSHAQDLSSEAPCLLLFEGEDISDFDILKNHLDQGIAAPVYAQLEHPEHLELAPRLFNWSEHALLVNLNSLTNTFLCRYVSTQTAFILSISISKRRPRKPLKTCCFLKRLNTSKPCTTAPPARVFSP